MSYGNQGITKEHQKLLEKEDKCIVCGNKITVIHKGQIKKYCSKNCRKKRNIIK